MAKSTRSRKKKPHPLLKKADIERLGETAYQHRLNKNALRHTRALGGAAGMTQLGVHLVRLQPGRDSTEYHYHHSEEEFVYILSGRGETDIGEQTYPLEPGDFMGFSAPSLPHVMRNPFDEDLVYLVGGQSLAHDVTEYPRIGKTMYKVAGERHVVDGKHIKKL